VPAEGAGAAVAQRVARLHAAGLAASDDGRPAHAVRTLRAGLRLTGPAARRGDAGLAELHSRLLISLAWAESERGQVETGFALLDEAEEHVTAAQRPVLHAQRALLLKRSGRYGLALAQYDQAVGLLTERDSPLDLVKALNNRSLVHLETGSIRQARADLHRCGRIAARHGLALHVALSQVNLGCMDVVSGDLPAALAAFAAARADYERLAPGRLASLAVERSRGLLAAGLFGAADRELADAAEQAAAQQLSYTAADAAQVRAEAALLAGQPDAAARWASDAAGRFRQRGDARRTAIATLTGLRAGLATGGTPPAALAAQALAVAGRLTRLGLPEDARVAGLVAARALIRTGRPSAAARAVEKAGRPGRIDRLDTRLLWRLTRAELATAAAQPAASQPAPVPVGQPPLVPAGQAAPSTTPAPSAVPAVTRATAVGAAAAARELTAGLTALHRHRAQFGCLDLQTGAAVHGQDLARAGLAAAAASGSPAAVYRWTERARAQALLLPPARPPADQEAAAALEELRQARHSLRAAELAGRAASGLPARIDALQRRVREQSWATPGQRAVPPAAPAPLAAVRAALRDGTPGDGAPGRGAAALVSYLRQGPDLAALVITDRRARLRPLGPYAEAAEAVLRLRADLDAQAGRVLPPRLSSAVRDATRQDAAVVAAGLLGPLLADVGDRDLVVVPTGLLATVPWAVLPGCDGRPVTVAPSATAWLAARQRLADRQPRAGRPPQDSPGPALLVAGPGNDRGDAEIAAVAAWHPVATVLTGAQATPAATLAGLEQAGIAHLAAHGQHQAENALFATLELDGGPLLGYDLQRLARVPRMVVLSCCDLGLTDVRPGDETFGIVTALLTAGAATVVASVARVGDETAMAAMTGFHRAVAGGAAPAAALAAALPPAGQAGFVCFGTG
jgi:tetratricopeptide (TPR) repeat protein